MANTFELISSVNVGSGGAASIDFTSIPSTYTDLCLKLSGRVAGTGSGTQARIQFNGNSSGYSDTTIDGNGATVIGFSRSASAYIYITSLPQGGGSNPSPNTWGSVDMYIPNYAGANPKSVSMDGVTEGNISTTYADLVAGLWNNTAAITSISLTSQDASNFVQYSTAYLYGVKNA
jgi:hypothetical protein